MAWFSQVIRVKAVSAVLTGGLAAGMVVLPVATASASSAAGAERCDSRGGYSWNEWQYGQLSLCANTIGRTLNFSAAMENLQYYWGGAWYNNKYPTRVVFEFYVYRHDDKNNSVLDQKRIFVVETNGTNTDRDTARGSVELPAAGNYSVSAHAFAYGQYWGSPDNIEAWNHDGKNIFGQFVPESEYKRSSMKTNSDVFGFASIRVDNVA